MTDNKSLTFSQVFFFRSEQIKILFVVNIKKDMKKPVLVCFITATLFVASSSAAGTHWIVIPEFYTPGAPLPLTFNFYNTSGVDVVVQVDLVRDKHYRVATLQHTFREGKSEILQLQIPDLAINPHSYTLLINGTSGLFFQECAVINSDLGWMTNKFTIHIQTDKSIYKAGQTVRFRTFGISSDMVVYTGDFNIAIYDPKGNQMMKKIKVSEPQFGVVEEFLVMDTEPVLGKWKITVRTNEHSAYQERYFTVDEYVLPKFLINIKLPPFVVTTDKEIHGTVKAEYTDGKPVIGFVKLYADVDYTNSPWKHNGDEKMIETTFDINGEAKFTVPFSRITNAVDPSTFQSLVKKLAGYHLQITAVVTESINNITREEAAEVLFHKKPYNLNFDHSSSPSFFKPGLPYVGYVKLTKADDSPIISDKTDVRLVSYELVYVSTAQRYRGQYLAEQTYAPPPNGILKVTVNTPVNATSLHLEIFYQGLVDTMTVDKPHWLLDSGNIQVSQISSDIFVGKPAVFDVQRADGIHHIPLFYTVIANYRIVQTGYLNNNASNTLQISFPVTDMMKPYGELIVCYFDNDVWNADAIYFDVNPFRNKVALSFDKNTAEPGENVSLTVTSDPMSLVNLLAVDQSVYQLTSGNDITQDGVISSLVSMPSYASSNLHNPQKVMTTRGMQLLTDVEKFNWAHSDSNIPTDCIPMNELYPGLWGTATTTPADILVSGDTRATQHWLVPGRTTTIMPGWLLPKPPTASPDPVQLKKVSNTRDFFLETWLWTDVIVGDSGRTVFAMTVPDAITSWYATAFSVNKHSGLGVTGSAAKFKTSRPFFINLNLPFSVVRGEQVVLQADVFNYMGQDLDVVVTLEKSDDFKVIFKDSGHVSLKSVEFLKTLHIEAGKAESVFIPVVATTIGVANVAAKAQSPYSADRVKREFVIQAEGTTMHFNVPLILNEHTSVDVPLSFPPTFVANSQKIQVSAISDAMGPTLNNLKSLLRMPTGCGEQTMINLAPAIFVYNYLKKTHRLKQDVALMALDYMQKGYQRLLTFRRYDGSFSTWGERDLEGSMWLTAFVLKSLQQAKEHIYVSDDVLVQAANWILRYQNFYGTFQIKGSVHNMNLQGGYTSSTSLTAFVLIALTEAKTTISHAIFFDYATRVIKARQHLEGAIESDRINDPYHLAIISYALSKSESIYANLAYTKLQKIAVKTGDGKMYWNSTRRHQLSSWEYSYYQSPPIEIEVASYALLYLVDSRQLQTGFPILQWLISQRNSRGSFRSTQDTVLGLQAMSEYGATFGDNIDLTIAVNSGTFHKQLHIGRDETMVLKLLDIPHTALSQSNNSFSPPPTVSLQGHGAGTALVQVSVSFNVETEVSLPAFNITETIVKESLRSIVLKTCTRYLQRLVYQGMAVIEIDLPSGFSADLESPETKLEDAKNLEIRDKKTVVLYYDQISLDKNRPTCATIEMIRTDFVAKTKPAAIRVFDYYEPDNRALAFYESQLLKDSSYCDICNHCGCL